MKKKLDEPSAVTGDQGLSMLVIKISTFQFYLHSKLNRRQIERRISSAVSQYVIKE